MLEPYSLEKEERVRKFWKEKSIPEKARQLNEKNNKCFFMIDGPPYATGHIHMGTALNKILKDVTIRQKRMQGFNVRDQPGYDTHGVPIENKVEKKFKFKNKQDIERFGVKKFVQACKKFATEFIDTMNQEFGNLGVWMDWQHPYLTLTNDYIEAIWWTFKKADERGLLYLGKYPVHVCPRCETAVAYNEISYTKLTDVSIYVKFPLAKEKNKFLIIWTTTPWTLPGNTGIMVHPKYNYAEVELSDGETWVIAEKLVQELMNAIEAGYTVKKVFKGKKLEGLTYVNPLKPHLNLKEEKLKNGYRVILSERYVNLEEGTGLVHTAPGHGKEDFDAGTKAGLPVLSPIKMNGQLTKEAGKYAGKIARVVDKEIVSDLEKDGFLVYKHDYTHDYPVCWRCETPLLMFSVPQWFFKISGIQKKMLQLNEEVKWVPRWGQDRFRNWLESIGDWPISRARYWGTPIPIWVCENCKEKLIVGSLDELKKHADIPKDIELHKPDIDNIIINCKKCSGLMKRVPDVLDVWFDSGVCTWGSLGYPKNKELFEKFWPADVNIEGTDQIRGWWNSQLITSTICFNKKPFNAILMHGMLALGKVKMSKSLGNVVQPSEVIEKYNRDYLRFFLVSVVKGEDIEFDWNAFKDIHRFFNIFWNTYNFASMYLKLEPGVKEKPVLNVEDEWILSRLNSLTKAVLQNYNNYTYPKIVSLIEEFVLEDLSRTYIKLVRNRVGTKTEKALSYTLSKTLFSLLKLMAPITPHITEYIYQNLRSEKMPESIHLLQFPKADEKMIKEKLEKEMALAKEVSQNVLSMREENKLRLRWPLKELVIQSKSGKELTLVKELLEEMCNVKSVTESKKKPKGNFAEKEFEEMKIFLSLEADNNLKEEWEFRELVRRVQEKRKQAKLHPSQKVELFIKCSDSGFLKKFGKALEKETNTKLKEKKGKMEKLLSKEFFIELKK